jgi:hypothetical protein
MAVRTILLYGNPGATSVTYPDLFGREIVLVHREGTQYDEGTPGNREWLHTGAQVSFEIPFAGPTTGRPGRFALERVHITYKV